MKSNFKEKIIGFFRNDWQLKLISVLLAIVGWFLICEYVDPETDTMVNNISILVNYEGSVPEKEGLGIMTTIEDTVSIKVSGSRDTIALMDTNKITASLDMSNVTRSGEYDLPVKISLGDQNIALIDQSIESVKVRFDKNIVKSVKIDTTVEGDVEKGFIREEPKMLNNYITVTGPQAIVDTIVSAEIKIKQDKFVETNTFNCDYTFVDSKGKEVAKTFLSVDVSTVDVTVAVVKEKTVPFSVSIVNSSGGNDKAFCEAIIKPENIKISGNAEVLDAINSIDLGVIDVAEQTKDFETTLNVVVPNGIKNVENIETAKVTVKFKDVQQKTFTVSSFNLINLPDGVSGKIKESKLSIKVRGLPADIKALSGKDVKVVVDANGQILSPGSHRLSALVDFPDESNVGVVGKYQLTVVVS